MPAKKPAKKPVKTSAKKPVKKLPLHWGGDYREIVERRIALVESDRNIGLIERPEYKRRWNTESWEDQEKQALRNWLLDRLEAASYWPRSGALQPIGLCGR